MDFIGTKVAFGTPAVLSKVVLKRDEVPNQVRRVPDDVASLLLDRRSSTMGLVTVLSSNGSATFCRTPLRTVIVPQLGHSSNENVTLKVSGIIVDERRRVIEVATVSRTFLRSISKTFGVLRNDKLVVASLLLVLMGMDLVRLVIFVTSIAVTRIAVGVVKACSITKEVPPVQHDIARL